MCIQAISTIAAKCVGRFKCLELGGSPNMSLTDSDEILKKFHEANLIEVRHFATTEETVYCR